MTTLGANEPTATDVVSAVKAATANVGQRTKSGGFSLSKAGTGEFVMAALFGLYLGYAVVRLPEVFVQLAIPKLPMTLLLIFLTSLLLLVPSNGWELLWAQCRPMRLGAILLGIAIGTAPIGIWPSESYDFIKSRYIISVSIFLCCIVFLRDRRTFRLAAAIYVLCVGAVSYNVIKTYDPNGPVLNEDGDVIDPAVLASRPELRRLQVVGVSLDSNDFGAILATTFPLALWLSVGNFRRRVFWTGVAGLFVMAVVPTQSRGSMLGFMAAATVLIGAGARGWRRWLTILLVGAGVGAFILMATGMGSADRFSDFGAGDYNVSGNEGRLYFWKQGFVWMLKRPWGYGIANFPTYFGELNGPERAAHSTWVQYGMELGVAGIVTFVLLCKSVVGGLRKLRKAAVQQRDTVPEAKDEEVLAGHMLAVMTGVLVTGSFLANAYYALTYMALGMGAAVLIGTPLKMNVSEPKTEAPVPAGRGVLPRRRLRAFPQAKPGS
ncbi:MAG: O-antigen ligase family protein [Gemmatimonadota bacterium]